MKSSIHFPYTDVSLTAWVDNVDKYCHYVIYRYASRNVKKVALMRTTSKLTPMLILQSVTTK